MWLYSCPSIAQEAGAAMRTSTPSVRRVGRIENHRLVGSQAREYFYGVTESRP